MGGKKKLLIKNTEGGKKMKRITSFILMMVLCFMTTMPAYAVVTQEKNVSRTKEDVLMEYHLQMQFSDLVSDNNSRTIQQKKQITEHTIAELEKLGYEAYDVNSETYDAVERELGTSFENMNLHKEYSYVIAIGEEPQLSSQVNGNTREHISNVFLYTYNNKVYRMRTVTITAADDPNYAKASTVDLLKSASYEVIKNCLDTMIYAYISKLSEPVGLVMSLCGLSIEDFNTSSTSTLVFHGGTNWTRVYTQVYDSYYEHWWNGSCVEYAVATSYMSGQYYSAEQNRYLSVPYNAVSRTLNSEHFDDHEWRRSEAVRGLLYYQPQHDVTGDVRYKYGNKVIITHYENFL